MIVWKSLTTLSPLRLWPASELLNKDYWKSGYTRTWQKSLNDSAAEKCVPFSLFAGFTYSIITTFNLCASEGGRLQADCRHMGGVEKVYPKLAMSGANIWNAYKPYLVLRCPLASAAMTHYLAQCNVMLHIKINILLFFAGYTLSYVMHNFRTTFSNA